MNTDEKADSLLIYVLSEDYAGYDSLFWGQFGISFLLDLKIGSSRRRILFDTATHAEPILHNMDLLGIKPKHINVVVLSHHHFDHSGGLAGIMEAIDGENVPVVAHPGIFKTSVMAKPYSDLEHFPYLNIGFIGKNTKENIEKLGGRWILAKDPICLMTATMTTGQIEEEEKVDYEKGPTPALQHIVEGRLSPDYIADEISLFVNTAQGLVVITGCSHPGIVSIVDKAITTSGIKEVEAVIGGFHLIDAPDEKIDQTVEGLSNLNVRRIYSGHCTGVKAEEKLRERFGDGFNRIYSGKIIEIQDYDGKGGDCRRGSLINTWQTKI